MARGNNPHWKALLRDYRLTKPLIAAVEGYAVAGGTEILQGTDIRIAGESAIFGVWEAKRGLFPLGGSACRLPRQIPYTQAMDILLSCRPIPAIEAKEMGLIGRVVPEGTALDVAKAVARAGRRERAAVDAGDPARVARDRAHERLTTRCSTRTRSAGRCSRREDAQEGPKAFAEKRAPCTRADDGVAKPLPGFPTHPSSRRPSAPSSRPRCAR